MPTRFLISTVRRHTPPEEPSGYIYLVDYAARQVVQRCSIIEPAFREEDDNPRGGMRGGKGISVRPDQIALANFSRIVRYDPQWNILGEISHPSCAGIHDIRCGSPRRAPIRSFSLICKGKYCAISICATARPS